MTEYLLPGQPLLYVKMFYWVHMLLSKKFRCLQNSHEKTGHGEMRGSQRQEGWVVRALRRGGEVLQTAIPQTGGLW